MGIITLLISLVFSCNFINCTVSTNYLASHAVALTFSPIPKAWRAYTNQLFLFNDNYIASYHANNTPVTIGVKIDTSNLNLNNKIYWVNDYGGVMGSMLPLKWTYSFNVNVPNTSMTQAINLNKIGYDYTWTAAPLSFLTNLNELNSFANNFFNNATIKLPYKMLIACTPYSEVTNYFTLKGPYYVHNPNLTFSKWVTYKLFNAPHFNLFNMRFANLMFPMTKNNLFLDINLSNCQANYQFQLGFVGQLDRYMVCLGDNLNYHYQPTYSNDVIGYVNFTISDLLPNEYYFNPQDLFFINQPDSLNSSGWAYTSFPKLQFSLNQFLLTRCYDANLVAQLVDIINTYANSIHNQELLNLSNELWTKGLWSSELATKVFNLVNNDQTYNATTNTLAVNFQKNVAVQSLINYLQMALANNQPAWWYSYLQRICKTKTPLNLTPTNCINLYQTLLRTYQNSKIQYTFSTITSTAQYTITYQNLSIALNANNCCKYVLPYDYYYQIIGATFAMGNYTQGLNISGVEFSILKYPQVINNYQVNLPPANSIVHAYLGVDAFQLQLLNNIPSLTLFNLEQTYHLTSSELASQIKAFNANYNCSIATFNAYLQKPLTKSLIDLALYQTYFNLFSNDDDIIQYCNQYGFDNNLLASSNNSLLSNFQIEVYNAKKGIYSVNFNINNLINYLPLIDDRCFYVPTLMELQDYSTPVQGFFYLSPSILNPAPTPVKKATTVPATKKPVKVTPVPIKKVVHTTPKKVPITPPIKKVYPPAKPLIVPKPVIKPIVINNNQPILTKTTAVPPWGYFLIVLPIILVIVGFGCYLAYLKLKTLSFKKNKNNK